jgi:hypothetical protein
VDKLIQYRAIVKQVLTDWNDYVNRSPRPGIDHECVFDEERDHYLWVSVGWEGKRRIRGTPVYLRIRNGKIWIEDDWTEEGIAGKLLEAGVPKEDIVLGFQHPSMRPMTEFAVA